MPKYNVKIPIGIYKINATNRKDAIDIALRIYKDELAQFVASGKMYSVPAIATIAKQRNAMVEMSVDQPIKPGRHLNRPVDGLKTNSYRLAKLPQ